MKQSSLDRDRGAGGGRASASPSTSRFLAPSLPPLLSLLLLLLLPAGGRRETAMTTAFVVVVVSVVPRGGRRRLPPHPRPTRRADDDASVVVRDRRPVPPSPPLRMSDRPPPDDVDDDDAGGGADLAAQFFRALSERDISLGDDDLASAEEDDDLDDAILREYDVPPPGEGGYAGSLTNEQIYDEVRDRVLESAGAFVELTKGADDVVDDAAADGMVGGGAYYRPPTVVPDSGLTAGEVVELVLAALRNNDVPSPDYGVEVLFGYSSPESLISEQIESEGLTPSQYRNFLRSSEENAALFDHASVVIDKADFSPDRLKGYFTARLIAGYESSIENDVSVNFILSTTGANDDDCWLIDSMLIRPSKLRRRRRR
ncbi:hypothetical protein ACHAW5_003973 [Stephanodiscus triporus]|uniref:Uncharacterized protein n=1 Tax=Stephanodiscus triporus TaxID=2934178 RepID=A0ABD3N446_9STRA